MHFSLFLQLLPTLRSLQCQQHIRRITIAFLREERKENQSRHEKKVQDRLMNYNQRASWCQAKAQRYKAWERVPEQAAHSQDCLLALTNGPQEFQQLLQSTIVMYLKMPLLPRPHLQSLTASQAAAPGGVARLTSRCMPWRQVHDTVGGRHEFSQPSPAPATALHSRPCKLVFVPSPETLGPCSECPTTGRSYFS